MKKKLFYLDQKISKVWEGSYFVIKKVLSISEAIDERSFFEINWSPVLEVAFFHNFLVSFHSGHYNMS